MTAGKGQPGFEQDPTILDAKIDFCNYTDGVKTKADPYWRKALLAARILLRARKGCPLSERNRILAHRLADDPGVTDRLIDQAIACQTTRQKNHVSA